MAEQMVVWMVDESVEMKVGMLAVLKVCMWVVAMAGRWVGMMVL